MTSMFGLIYTNIYQRQKGKGPEGQQHVNFSSDGRVHTSWKPNDQKTTQHEEAKEEEDNDDDDEDDD